MTAGNNRHPTTLPRREFVALTDWMRSHRDEFGGQLTAKELRAKAVDSMARDISSSTIREAADICGIVLVQRRASAVGNNRYSHHVGLALKTICAEIESIHGQMGTDATARFVHLVETVSAEDTD
jgi:hypothetical protein